MYYYSFTIRKTEHPVFINDYNTFIEDFRNTYPLANIKYHYEDSFGLHLHGMAETHRRIYINKIHPGKGYNLKLEFTRSRLAWDAYITKDRYKEPLLIRHQWDIYNEYKNFQEMYSDDDYVIPEESPNATDPTSQVRAKRYQLYNLFTGALLKKQ